LSGDHIGHGRAEKQHRIGDIVRADQAVHGDRLDCFRLDRCDIAYAPRLTYADQYNIDAPKTTPVGVNCYLCERPNCRQRAHAPLNKALNFDERARNMSLFRFDEE
jgi:predicted transcriptional regulator